MLGSPALLPAATGFLLTHSQHCRCGPCSSHASFCVDMDFFFLELEWDTLKMLP